MKRNAQRPKQVASPLEMDSVGCVPFHCSTVVIVAVRSGVVEDCTKSFNEKFFPRLLSKWKKWFYWVEKHRGGEREIKEKRKRETSQNWKPASAAPLLLVILTQLSTN